MDYLFTYGTLQDPQVQEYIFGKKLIGQADSLSGFKILENAVYDRYSLVVHTKNPNHRVMGKVYEVSETDFEKSGHLRDQRLH